MNLDKYRELTKDFTIEQKVEFAIRSVLDGEVTEWWRSWAEKWLLGIDRSVGAANDAAINASINDKHPAEWAARAAMTVDFASGWDAGWANEWHANRTIKAIGQQSADARFEKVAEFMRGEA